MTIGKKILEKKLFQNNRKKRMERSEDCIIHPEKDNVWKC